MILKEKSEEVLYSKTISELSEVVGRLLELVSSNKIWIFRGDLGSGKTTLIKSICKELGYPGHVTSPSFSLINEYSIGSEEVIYHFDFYRLDDEEEAYQLGLDEYFYSDQLCLIEWPERVPSFIPEKHIEIRIETDTDQTRNYYITQNV